MALSSSAPVEGIYNAIPYLQASDVRGGLNPQSFGGGWNVSAQGQSILDRLRAQLTAGGRFAGERGSVGVPQWLAASRGGAQLPGQLALQSLRSTVPTIENIAGAGGIGAVPRMGFNFPNLPGGLGAGAVRAAGSYPGFNPGLLGAGAATAEAAAPTAASWAARFAPVLAKGTLLRGGMWGLGGQAAAGIANQAGAPQWVGNSLAGAGIGAGIGTIVPGIGTGIGAGVGALAGAGLGFAGINLGGGGGGGPSVDDDDRKMAQNMIKRLAQLDPAAAAGARQSFRVMKSQGGDAEAQGIQTLLQNLPAQIAQGRALKNQGGYGLPGQPAKLSKNALLAQQMMVGQIMAEQAARTQSLGQVQADYIRGIAPTLPDAMRGVAEWDAATRLYDAQQMGNAFTGSVLAKPVFDQYQNQLSQYAQLMQQQQAMAAAQSGGGGSQSLSQLLASQAA